MNYRCLGIGVLSLGVALSQLPAQSAGSRSPGTLGGVVLDSNNVPIASVEVRLDRRATQSAADGRFRFDSVAPGTYTISARKIGLRAELQTVKVGKEGALVEVRMSAIELPAVVTQVARLGLGGIVWDSSYQPLAGAQVVVVGGQGRATTDSTGAFHMDVRPGEYMVRVDLPGYRTRMVSVTIPPNDGRRVAISMSRSAVAMPAREAAAVFDLQRRLVWRSPARSWILTREQLAKSGFEDLNEVVASAAGAIPNTKQPCYVYLDGGPDRQVLWAMQTADVELLEVYMARPMVQGPGARGGSALSRQTIDSPPPTCGSLSIMAWLRK